MSKPAGMKRYAPVSQCHDQRAGCNAVMQETSIGDYIRHDDPAILAAIETQTP